MNLSIEITPNSSTKQDGFLSCLGKIYIGDNFWETIAPALNYWTIEEYKKQWREGLERIKTHSTSCLVASIQNPHTSNRYLNWWILYKEKNKIFIHNHMMVAEDYSENIGTEPFTTQTCYNFIPPRITHSPEGWKYSEWVIDAL